MRVSEVEGAQKEILTIARRMAESGEIVLARSLAQTRYPARFQLVLAANPCPCGQAGTPGGDCRCPAMSVRRYTTRISGPILDRIDISQSLAPMRRAMLRAASRVRAESSAMVAERVALARERQRERLAPFGFTTNASVPGPVLELYDLANDPGETRDVAADKKSA